MTDAGVRSPWTTLFRVGAISLAVSLVIIPVQLAVFILWPLPELDGATEWFALLQTNRFAGLVSLDLLLVLDWLLLVPVYVAFFVLLRRASPSWSALGLAAWAVALAAFLASNPAIEMAALSDRWASAANDTERAGLIAAGEALLARWEGTAFHVSYILGQFAGIVVGALMLRSESFGRVEAWLLIAGNGIGFAYYLPEVGLMLSAFSGLVLWAWYALALRSFLRLGWPRGGHAPARASTA